MNEQMREWTVSFEEWLLQHQIEYIKPARKARLVITKANVTTLLEGQELLYPLLHAAGDMLVNVDQSYYVWRPEGQSKVLYGPVDRKAGAAVLVAGL